MENLNENISDIKLGRLTTALSRFYFNNNDIKIEFNKAKIISPYNSSHKAMIRASKM